MSKVVWAYWIARATWMFQEIAPTSVFGFQESNAVYLDPHKVQSTIKSERPINSEDANSYRCSVPQLIPLDEVDPSLAIGILSLSKEDFFQFVTDHQNFESTHNPCMFNIEHATPDYLDDF
jgi:hypothetical protein